MTDSTTFSATFSATLPNEAATAHLMADLALLLGAGDIITLTGDLGAGKTTAARAMIRYLADDRELEVPSPTFTLVQAYDLPSFALLHADLYRIADASEMEEIGLSPFTDATVVLIEWPERAGDALPPDRIDIAFSHRNELGAEARTAEIRGHGKAAAQVARLETLRQFLEKAGIGNRIEAACLPTNDPSRNLLAKAGFRQEGLARRYIQINGEWQDHALYALLAEEAQLGSYRPAM